MRLEDRKQASSGTMSEITVISQDACALGEGPVWDHSRNRLFWIDSIAAAIFCLDFSSRKITHYQPGGKTLGSLAVCQSGNLILAMDTGFYHYNLNNKQLDLIASPLQDKPGQRMNDGKVDPLGNFVSGAMGLNHQEPQNCSMYRLSPDGQVETLLDGFFCFNGPCFNLAGNRIYVTGRQEGVIEQLTYGDRLTEPTILHDKLNPDGATVDADGYIWSAQWDDHSILRISPEGDIDYRIEISGQIVSSIMFGGENLDKIFVTTISDNVWGTRTDHEDAGQTFMIENTGFSGRPENYFND